MYVLDTNVISNLHKNYYRKRFVSLWKAFDQLVADDKITSTREVYQELHRGWAGRGWAGADTEWAKVNKNLFASPNAEECAFVTKIYSVVHFQANIERQKFYNGGLNADAFITARAYAIKGTVVTMERLKPNSVKIPNICEHFNIPCLDLEGFMESEGWEF
ncbi:DUF4411 family protein [Xylella fastidiosa subsp. multiplex]|uniref:DUF4411 family protein n=1 Tax=Xylella fastidiosa subsp. multiplex TaxID=644357 RepID=A0A9Q4MG08_XYLFS|nr:PIN domain-containing protein [Xylella fastidiosa]KAJ4853381.1 DUF4411 family protein [Xylella fastidiosa subsp. multiplex]MBE0269700.1 DUF4411 family protein [Xylella fastidiosa subsp. multiplex]MBE0275219.1 DUF4411 family protein [Xylella fastidiosa subsp. multiplex]MBE0278504.1 DUF4411 family protein [Xylella fastidiosa subsp. multiplex]MBE0282909.1 DUF4411 family protein [Xylella fastidiosa subsp. multiplex]